MMFNTGEIWAYPTNTSFGLGVRIDDQTGLQAMNDLKQRPAGKFFSLMVKNRSMLQQYAQIPKDFPPNFFSEKPRTALLKPKKNVPISKFWPAEKVAFRVCQIPKIAQHITVPITSTSANISGEPALFTPEDIEKKFKTAVKIIPIRALNQLPQSEIWDYTVTPPKKIR